MPLRSPRLIRLSSGTMSGFGPKPKSTDVRSDVGNWVITGLVVLTMSFVGRDPKPTFSPSVRHYTLSQIN